MRLKLLALAAALAAPVVLGQGSGGDLPTAVLTYSGSLSGAAEAPPNASPGSGTTTVTYDSTAHLLGLSVNFTGLLGNTTAAHIHCCTSVPGVGTAGVATQTPTFSGFPLGVTSGTYSNTFDLTLAPSWNAAFITANGGTPAGAEAALAAGLAAGRAYLNIHTSSFPGGEIRAFLGFAKGDFNSDGLPDLVFRQVSNGAHNKVWFMDGVTRTSEAAITPDAASTAWLIRGVDDFDDFATPGSGRDNKNDLVFWNQATGNVEFWLMNGTNRPGAAVPLTGGAVLPTNWDLSATADFSHDGRADIVWRNFTSQKIVIWKMGEGAVPGTQKTGNIIPTPDQAVDPNWLIVAAADYSGDGNTDFLWYNYSSGRIVTWYMDTAVVRTSGQFTTPNAAGDFNWKVVAGSDYSRTYVPGTPPLGSPDIVWRNETSGNQVVWHLDFNSTRVHGQFTNPTSNTPALDWVIVGPR